MSSTNHNLDARLHDAGYNSNEYTLKKTQREVLEWMERPSANNHKGAIIAHEPGFGKTSTALARIALSKKQCDRIGKKFRGALVVCSPSIIKNWVIQTAQFFPEAKFRLAFFERNQITYYCNGHQTYVEKVSGYRLNEKHMDSFDIALCTYHYPVTCFKQYGMNDIYNKINRKLQARMHVIQRDNTGLESVATKYAYRSQVIRDNNHLNDIVHWAGEFGIDTNENSDSDLDLIIETDYIVVPSWYRVRADMDNHLMLGLSMWHAASESEKQNVPLFLANKWDHIVLDEAHGKLVKPTSNTSIVFTALEADHKLILSGTPVRHHDHNMWTLLKFLETPQLPSYKDLKRLYSTEKMVEKDRITMREYVENFIHLKRHHIPEDITESFLAYPMDIVCDGYDEEAEVDRRHPDEELAIEAHDEWVNLFKRDVFINALDDPLEYIALENACNPDMYEPIYDNEGEIVLQGTSSIGYRRFGRIRQAVTDPSLLPNTLEYPMSAGATHSTKVRMMVDYVCDRTLVRADEKVIVFCTWTKTIKETASRELQKRGIRSLSITGSTNKKMRDDLVDEFGGDGKYRLIDDRNEPRVMLATYCLGEGVDRLKRANHVVFLNQDYVKCTYIQATARAHRIGQTRDVHVVNFLVDKNVNPIDDRILEIQKNAGKKSRHIMDNVVLSLLCSGKTEEKQDIFVSPPVFSSTLGKRNREHTDYFPTPNFEMHIHKKKKT